MYALHTLRIYPTSLSHPETLHSGNQTLRCFVSLLIVHNPALLLFFLCVSLGAGAVSLPGLPPMVAFPPGVTGGGLQHADVSIGQDGAVAVANTAGLLLHDGADWSVLPLPNGTSVRSVEWLGARIYVGGQGAFGYFARSHIVAGPYQFVDLSDRLQAAVGPFEDVWRTVKHGDTVLLSGSTFVASCSGQGEFQTLARGKIDNLLPSGEAWAFASGGRLKRLDGSAEGPILPAGVRAEALIPRKDGSTVLLTHAHGVFVCKSGASVWSPIPGAVDAALKRFRTNCIARGESGWHIGTSDGGILLTTDFTRLDGRIAKAQGLSRETVLCLTTDASGNLWAGLEGGLDLLAWADPARNPFKLEGRSVAGYGSLHADDFRYFATSQGLEAWSADGTRTLVKSGQAWSIARTAQSVLLGHHSGLFEVTGLDVKPIYTGTGVWGVWQLPGSNRYVAGTYEGLVALNEQNGAWTVTGELKGFAESARFVAVEDAEHVWVSHPYKGVWRIALDPQSTAIEQVQSIGRAAGFADTLGLRVHALEGQILFTADRGLLRWEGDRGRVVPEQEFADGLAADASFRHLARSNDGTVWYFTPGHLGCIQPVTRGIRPGTRIRHLPLTGAVPIASFESIEFMPNGNVCIPTASGFLVIDPQKMLAPEDAPRAVVHRVTHLNAPSAARRDLRAGSIALQPGIHALELSLGTEGNRWLGQALYQWRLPDVSDSWSEPATNPSITLPGLSKGTHRLEYRALLSPAFAGPPTTMTVDVPPAWYGTVAARLAFATLALGAGYAVLYAVRRRERLNNVHALAEAQADLVREREERAQTELELRNQELASATLHLMEKGEALATVRKGLLALRGEATRVQQKSIQELIHVIQQDERFDAGWEQFSQQFDRVHVDFQSRLRERFPHLTKNDLRLCAYIRMNLSSKEIAALMFVSVRAVEISRFRLRKRLDLDKGANLQEFIQRL